MLLVVLEVFSGPVPSTFFHADGFIHRSLLSMANLPPTSNVENADLRRLLVGEEAKINRSPTQERAKAEGTTTKSMLALVELPPLTQGERL